MPAGAGGARGRAAALAVLRAFGRPSDLQTKNQVCHQWYRAVGRWRTLFVHDEPTTGLHPADTLKLLDALGSLLVFGHSVIVVEHSPEMMFSADGIIDLGPGAGDEGGRVVAQGTP